MFISDLIKQITRNVQFKHIYNFSFFSLSTCAGENLTQILFFLHKKKKKRKKKDFSMLMTSRVWVYEKGSFLYSLGGDQYSSWDKITLRVYQRFISIRSFTYGVTHVKIIFMKD